MGRIVLNTFGSLGDVHPYLGIAVRLRERGHDSIVATAEIYRQKILDEGVGFAPVRPDVGELLEKADLLEKLWDARRGSEFLIRDYILPRIEQSYEDLLAACKGADLILTHVAGYGGPIVAEVLRVPWLSVVLQPIIFFSAYDPPFVPSLGRMNSLLRPGRIPFRLVTGLASLQLKRWAEPIQQLRMRGGLPRAKQNPLMRGQFSPFGTLALFSRHFASPQPDWPTNTRQAGFVFHDDQGRLPVVKDNDSDTGRLESFLDAGTAPVLFTLGSSAVMQPGNFFRESLQAAMMAGVRAVLLVGSMETRQLGVIPDSVYVAAYLPYSEIMLRCAAIVHQGGIGTTAQALRAGRPMLVMPFAHDQPDNAERLRRLGVARVVPREHYAATRVQKELTTLLHAERYRVRVTEICAQIAQEDGLNTACDAIDNILDRRAER